MKPTRVQLHDSDRLGSALWSYGNNEFVVQSTNRMVQSAAHISTSVTNWFAIGADITGPVFNEVPADFDGPNSEIVNTGVATFEWTGTGIEEQFQSISTGAGVSNGDVVDFGILIYLEANSSRDLDMYLRLADSNDAFLEFEGPFTATVNPDEWTWVKGQATVSNPSAFSAGIVAELEGRQQIGDKIHVGMSFINVGSDDVPRPSTLMDRKFHVRAKFRQIGGTNNSGQIASSQSSTDTARWGLSSSYENPYSRLTYVNTVRGTSFNQLIDYELSYDRIYELEIEHDYISGEFKVYKTGRKTRNLIVDTTLTTTAGDFVELDNWGMNLMPSNWGVLYGFDIFDHAGILVESAPIKNTDIYQDLQTSTGTPVSITRTTADGNYLIADADVFEFGGNAGTDLNFTMLKSDRPEIDFSGDFFVATLLQFRDTPSTRNFIDARSGNGWFMDTTGTGDDKKWRAFVGNINLISNVIVNDGNPHYLGLRLNRTEDVAEIYTDDFETPETSTTVPTGNLNDSPDVIIGGVGYEGFMGPTVMFSRDLTEDERIELGEWMEFGYSFEDTPDFVLTDAFFYSNPNAPVQKAAIGQGGCVNLVNSNYTRLDLLWILRTLDGTAVPSIDHIEVGIPSIDYDPTADSTIYTEGSCGPRSIGPQPWQTGVMPTKQGRHRLVSDGGLGQQQYEDDFTYMMLITKIPCYDSSQTLEELINFGPSTRLHYNNSTGQFTFSRSGVTEISATSSLANNTPYLVSLKRTGSQLELSINGVTVDTDPANLSSITSDDEILYGGSETLPFHGVIHCVAEFDRYVANEEEAQVYSSIVDSVDFSVTGTLTDTFDYAELNWG